MIHLRCHILQKKIGKRDRGHSFYNNDCAGNDYRVVSSVDDDFGILMRCIYRLLRYCDRGCRFYCCPDDQSGAVAHASKRTSG